MNRRKKISMYAYIGAVIIMVGVALYFTLPYSPLKSSYLSEAQMLDGGLTLPDDRFSNSDIARLPEPAQQHFRACGFIGARKMGRAKGVHKGAEFYTAVDKKPLSITYTQVNYVSQPDRLAFIDATMGGVVPFQGYDRFVGGRGAMKGQLAKTVTLFNQQGRAMDQACLATVLSECLFVPSIALQDYIVWEAIDDKHARATISAYGLSASGIFEFDESGLMHTFTTDDRTYTDFAGNRKNVSWTAQCEDYRATEGVLVPTSFAAIWHLPEGDFQYFSSSDVELTFYPAPNVQ